MAANGVECDTVMDGRELRRLLGTFWFRSVFTRLSSAWQQRILDALGVAQAHFCGLSMGGMVGLGLINGGSFTLNLMLAPAVFVGAILGRRVLPKPRLWMYRCACVTQ